MAEQPTPVSADTGKRWAARLHLEFPELIVNDAPEWIWHDGTPGQYSGYLPADWDKGDDCSYAILDEWEENFGGLYERFTDLGVCTLVTRGQVEHWQDDPFPIERLTNLEAIAAWQEVDGWWSSQVQEMAEYVRPAFDGFQEVGAGPISLPPNSRLSSIRGSDTRLPYSEWWVELHVVGDQGALIVAGPPGAAGQLQKAFSNREAAAHQMEQIAEALGSVVE